MPFIQEIKCFDNLTEVYIISNELNLVRLSALSELQTLGRSGIDICPIATFDTDSVAFHNTYSEALRLHDPLTKNQASYG